MAAQPKEQGHGTPAGREKQGTSPSFPREKASPGGSTSTPVSDPKRVPNYLKSAKTLAPPPGKKLQSSTSFNSTTTTQTNKPTLNRRRSLDKPQSPNSRLHKPHSTTSTTTTTTGNTNPSTDSKNSLRSPSSSVVPKRSSSLPKLHQEERRFLKVHNNKDSGKSPSLYARSVKKTSTTIRGVNEKQNKGNASTASRKVSSPASDLGNTVDVVDPVVNEDQEASSGTDQEEIIKVDQHEEGSNIEEEEEEKDNHDKEQQHVMMHDADAELGTKNQYADLKPCEANSIEEDQNMTLEVQKMEDVEVLEACVEETSKDESNASHPAEEEEKEDGFLGEHCGIEGEENEKEEETHMDGKPKVDEEGITETVPTIEQKQEAAAAVEDQITATGSTGTELTKPDKAGKGKEFSRSQSQLKAYNEVIEETASKLILEKRRNKVKALVGAFETVISLQDHEGGGPQSS